MELVPHRDGYGHSFKRFMPALRLNVTEDPLLVFHSFRHAVATTLSRAKMDELKVADLMGHERDSKSESGKTYIDEAEVPELKEIVEKIVYPGLVLPRLNIGFKDKDYSVFEEVIVTKLPNS
jgi:hypothetical protein